MRSKEQPCAYKPSGLNLDFVSVALPRQEDQNKNKSMHSTNNFYEIQTPMNDERQEVLTKKLTT